MTVEPYIIHRECGGYLAISPPVLGKLRFAVTALTLEEVRAQFAKSLAEWQRTLSPEGRQS